MAAVAAGEVPRWLRRMKELPKKEAPPPKPASIDAGEPGAGAGGMLRVALPGPKGADAAQPTLCYAWFDEDEDGFLEVEAPSDLGEPRASITTGAGGAALLHLCFDGSQRPALARGASAASAWLPVPLSLISWAGGRLDVTPGLRSAEADGASVWEVQAFSNRTTPSRPSRALADPASAAAELLRAQAAGLVRDCQRRGWGVVDGFLRGAEADAVHLDIRRWWALGKLRDGQIGTGMAQRYTRSDIVAWLDEASPGSNIREPGTLPQAFRPLQRRIDVLVRELNLHVPEVRGSVECQAPMLAVYPGDGSCYKRHYDEGGGIKGGKFSGVPQAVQSLFGERPKRRCTMILYLNPFWRDGLGGELRLFAERGSPSVDDPEGLWTLGSQHYEQSPGVQQSRDEQEKARVHGVDVAPLHGRLLVFLCNNENAHEVLPAWRPRLAATWWVCEKAGEGSQTAVAG